MLKQFFFSRKVPILALSFILMITGITLTWMGQSAFESFKSSREIKETRFQTESLRNIIIYLDEVLFKSAQLAAYTGDKQWKKRYKKYQPLLSESIHDALLLSKKGYTDKAFEQLDKAYKTRLRLEDKAFALIKLGRHEEAKHLLEGAFYTEIRARYKESAHRFFVTQQAEVSLEKLWGRVIYLNEVVSMTVQLATVSNDSGFKKDYAKEKYEISQKELERSIEEALLLVPMGGVEQKKSQALLNRYKDLKSLDNQVFELLHSGKQTQAQYRLNSSLYRQKRKEYTQAITAFVRRIKTTADQNLVTEKNAISLKLNFLIFVICLLPICWLLVFNALNTWYQLMMEKNKELRELTKDLDKKVDEKTRLLSEERLKLIQAEKLSSIGQLAAGVAHEINNPVGYVKSNHYRIGRYLHIYNDLLSLYEDLSEAIQKGEPIENRLAEIEQFSQNKKINSIKTELPKVLELSNEGLLQVQEIVENLRVFSRSDGKEKEAVDLNERIEMTLNVVMNSLRDTCNITKNLTPIPRVQCHPGQIQQVLTNLLINASQAMQNNKNKESKKGTLTLSTRANEKDVILTLSDTGKGISKEHLEKIFEPFFTTKPTGEGTGLGLSISYDIIQHHGGSLTVESVEGEGSTFTLTLPI